MVKLMIQVADAAHTLHEAGIIHRDIKPSNIIIREDGTHAVLMDLGLVQFAGNDEAKLTRTRQFLGTLRYASPEQVLAAAELTCRSDVYSLGATIWELLTLRPLFGVTEKTLDPELMQHIQYANPDSMRQINKSVPKKLEAIVQKCLEKNPSSRYSSTKQLAEDLSHYLANEPILAKPERIDEKLYHKWQRQYPSILTICGPALLGVLLMGIFAGILFRSTILLGMFKADIWVCCEANESLVWCCKPISIDNSKLLENTQFVLKYCTIIVG